MAMRRYAMPTRRPDEPSAQGQHSGVSISTVLGLAIIALLVGLVLWILLSGQIP
jgi:hypothetical protein